MEKMTKKEMYAQVIAMAQGKEIAVSAEDIVAFAEHEIELLTKKSGKSGMTKTQKENEVYVEEVYKALVQVGKAVTVTEFQSASKYVSQFSNQKLSALLKKLVDAGRVCKTVEGKKSYFSATVALEVADTEEVDTDTEEVVVDTDTEDVDA
jgi:hypothetical protein